MMDNLAEKFPQSAHDIMGAELAAGAQRDPQHGSAIASPLA